MLLTVSRTMPRLPIRTIPKELGALTKLEIVSLSHNHLTGSIPKELGALSKLEKLVLFHNKLTGSVPAHLVKLDNLSELELGDNQFSGPVPSLQQLKRLHNALVSPRYGRKGELARMSMAKQHRSPGANEAKATGDDLGTLIGARMAAISDFEGCVVTWSFGDRPGLFRSHDFEVELEVPPLGRNVPVLIGLSSSSAEVVDGKQCLLHPIVTCLARAGEIFDPPLYLRFPVGDMDSAESGSEHGSQDDAELAYRARLESTFSVLTREDASAGWIPIHGRIVQTEEGLFLLQVTVSHFCDFALKQYINVDGRSVELIELPRLRHKSRRSHFHFVNLGTDELVVHCWGAARKRGFPELIRVKLGVGPMSGDAEVEARRTPVDVPGTVVYKVDVPGRPLGEPRNGACLVVDGAESLIVTYTTQETVCSRMGRTYEKVQVYGTRTMQHKHAMIFGDDLTGSKRMVSNLVVKDGDNVGEVVRSRVG